MLAQTPLDLNQIQQNAFKENKIPASVGELIGNALPYIFGAAGIALLIYLILGGFQLMTSGGDPKAIEGAKGKITNALIGFVIIIIAYALVALIGRVLGLGAFGNIFK
jgi:hypothetical protein